jgi:glycosyltransferase involved in cell wall biosynthesis
MRLLVSRHADTPPLLSICIPTWNRSKRLRSALDRWDTHLSRQIELVVVDNGSDDETIAVLHDFASRTAAPNLQFWTNEANLGADVNYLRVLELGRGDWLWLVGDDDAIDPARLSDLYKSLPDRPSVVLLSSPSSEHPGLPLSTELTLGRLMEERHDPYALALLQIGRFILNRRASLPHLRHAYATGVGHLHAYAFLSFGALSQGVRLRVTYVPKLLIEQLHDTSEQPRWNLLLGHVGAWRSSELALPFHRAAVRAREGRLRARAILRCSVRQLAAGRRIDPGVARWSVITMPGTKKAFALGLLLAVHLPNRFVTALMQYALKRTGRAPVPEGPSVDY